MNEGLEVRDLRKRYRGPWVLDGVDLDAAPGAITAILGPNGAGKSTLFKGLMGLLRFDGGTAAVAGRDVLGLPIHRKRDAGLGYLPQHAEPFAELSVHDDCLAIAELLPMPAGERTARVAATLDLVGLSALADRRCAVLSGGEARRLAIAKALLDRPRVLMLDEPFAGLDPLAVRDVAQLLRRVAADGAAVVITDHNVHDTLAIAGMVHLLAGGRVLRTGVPAEIAADPVVRSAYLGDGHG